jgi:hypothetical protein
VPTPLDSRPHATTPPASSDAPGACLEIAVYTVHPAAVDAFPAQQAALHALLPTLPGFRHAARLRGVDDPALFADYVLWASRAEAEAASAQLPALPGGAAFVAAIAELRTFAHLPVEAPAPTGPGTGDGVGAQSVPPGADAA